MSTTHTTVFDPDALAAVRGKALTELEEQCLTFARTAPDPIDRAAQAELAEEVRHLRMRWLLKGLLAEGAGREAAVAA